MTTLPRARAYELVAETFDALRAGALTPAQVAATAPRATPDVQTDFLVDPDSGAHYTRAIIVADGGPNRMAVTVSIKATKGPPDADGKFEFARGLGWLLPVSRVRVLPAP